MSRSYALNAETAKKGDGGGRITQTGQYVGKFTRAEAVKSLKGTEGVEFSFEADDGATADFLTLWTHNAQGKEIFGSGFLHAIMTCMKIKALTPKSETIQKWNTDIGAKAPVDAIVYPELVGKPIGLLLQMEQYLKQNGEVGEKMGIAGSYEPVGGFTASEILIQAKTAEKLVKKAAGLRDKLIDTSKTRRVPGGESPAVGGIMDDLDSDIPFSSASPSDDPIWKKLNGLVSF